MPVLVNPKMVYVIPSVDNRFFFFNSCTGTGRPLGLQDVETPTIYGQWFVSPTHRPPLPLWYSFLLEAESTQDS